MRCLYGVDRCKRKRRVVRWWPYIRWYFKEQEDKRLENVSDCSWAGTGVARVDRQVSIVCWIAESGCYAWRNVQVSTAIAITYKSSFTNRKSKMNIFLARLLILYLSRTMQKSRQQHKGETRYLKVAYVYTRRHAQNGLGLWHDGFPVPQRK